MKKKALTSFIVAVLVILCLIPTAYASEYPLPKNIETEISYLPNGCYIVSTIVEDTTPSSFFGTMQTKSGSKTKTVHSATGDPLYSITVYGTFSYNGNYAIANKSSYSYTDESPLWSFFDGSSSCSGSTVTATGVFESTFTTKTLNVSLSCSANGALS